MKKLIPLLILLAGFGFSMGQMTGCKRTPPPPTEQDAIAVWKNISRGTHLQGLVALKKTNGQMEKVNGSETYILYYQATVRDLVQLGNRAPGTIETYTGNFPFQWTEKGWMGPDQRVYPAH
ncbi:MAG TPA: hypothetical protein VGS10_19545 [Terracidiphilus sp.]|nr:hypothetical protein [Terracidiphilus sp.]